MSRLRPGLIARPAAPARRGCLSALAALPLLAACAGFSGRLAAPELRWVAVRAVRVELPQVRLVLELGLHNPNAIDLAVAGLEATVSIEGAPAAAVRLAASVTLLAGRTTPAGVEARIDAAEALASILRRGAGARALRYEVAGTVTLADGSRWPFSRRGETTVGGPPP